MAMPPRKGLPLLSPPKAKQPAAPFDLSTDRRRRSRLSVLKKELEAADAHIIAQRQNYAGWRDATLRVEQQQRENFSGLLSELKDMKRNKVDSSYCRFSMDGVERFSANVGLDRKEFVVTNVRGKKVGIGGVELSPFTALTSSGQMMPSPPKGAAAVQDGESAAEATKQYAPPRGLSIFALRSETGNPTAGNPTPTRRRSSVVVGRTPRSELLRQEKREQEKRDEEKEAQEKRDGFKKVDTSRDVAVAQTKSFLLRRDIGEAAAKEEKPEQRRSLGPGANWAFLSMNTGAIARAGRRSSLGRQSSGEQTPTTSPTTSPTTGPFDGSEQQPTLGERAPSSSTRQRRKSIQFVLDMDNVETVDEVDVDE